jgi:hypothetical protein
MELLDKFPLPVLQGMRAAISRAIPDEGGMISNTIPNLKRQDAPFRVSTNKDEYLSLIDAAIARRGAAAEEAEK